jgi:hypothetical protein
MLNSSGVNNEAGRENDLGMVICKDCGNVISTIPTNGITKIYGVCRKEACAHQGTKEA